ncbi:VRR-NUC domain protein [compost metagenome]
MKACFQRILADIKANRAGMPDLIQFWPQERRYRLIEVKGPGDRLQDNQLRWLEFCARHGIPVEVCYVQWADA